MVGFTASKVRHASMTDYSPSWCQECRHCACIVSSITMIIMRKAQCSYGWLLAQRAAVVGMDAYGTSTHAASCLTATLHSPAHPCQVLGRRQP